MKSFPLFTALALLTLAAPVASQGQEYTNFIRQIQYPSGVTRDVSVEQTGEQESPLSIDPGGARFELWTVKNTPLTSYLLDNKYVGAYIPTAYISIQTEDPYPTQPRTRADRPYWATIEVTGLLSGDEDPPASKQVRVTLHAQSYGENGNGDDIDRNDANLIAQGYISGNGSYNLNFTYHYIPSTNSTKARGEERLSVFSLEDYQAPADVITSQYVQIWPVADATITGIAQNGLYKSRMPDVNINLNDLYPDTRVYAQVYQGDAQLGTEGTIVPGSALIINHSVPQDRVLTLSDWDDSFPDDGRWTMEVITVTPFGTERLAHVTFELDRTIEFNGSVTTVE
ncbi:MAG: hypothetical protein KDN19_07335 [Verrucomicrobiae bacterium]|nr:hypothetical protein [Verrucomicrobiae bacterium]